jgi:hypothetical protein
LARAHAADFRLDPVKLGDPAQALGRNLGAVAIKDLFQLAPGRRLAMRDNDWRAASPERARQAVVVGVAIQLQDAVKALQDALCVLACIVRRTGKDHTGRIAPATRAVTSRQCPEIARLRPAPAGIQHKGRCLGRRLQVVSQSINHQTEMEGGGANAIGQGAAMQLDPSPGEDLALAIQ